LRFSARYENASYWRFTKYFPRLMALRAGL
jgi:hypothetical protein